MSGFWGEVYDAIEEMLFTEKVYVFKEIVDKPKTIREIAEKAEMPTVTVRKYIKWAASKGLATVAGTKKIDSAISEQWLLTIIPEIEETKPSGLVIKVLLKVKFRKEFCDQCAFREDCPHYERLEKGENITPYRKVEVQKRGAQSKREECSTEPIASVV